MHHSLHGLMKSMGAEKKKNWKKDPNLDRNGNMVELHQSENPWRPSKEKDDNEGKNRCVLRSIRGLLNSATPARKDALVAVFIEYKVNESPVLSEVISMIFDVAVETPAYCDLYASMCAAQVDAEFKKGSEGSRFKNEILKKVQEAFNTKTITGQVEDKVRRSRMGHINFIGHLYLERLISLKFMHFRVLDLLKSIDEREVDEGLIECAVRLIEKIGWKMEGEEEKYQGCSVQTIFDLLEKAKDKVSNRVRLLIMNLVEYHRDNWRERRDVVGFPPRKLNELNEKEGKKKDEEQKENEMAERRQLPGRGGRGRGGMGGRGGWRDGDRRDSPRQDDASRSGPRQILMRRDHSPPRVAAASTVEAATDTASSTSISTPSMRNQRGTLDSTGVLAMLTGGAPAPPFKQRDHGFPSNPTMQSQPERRVEQRRHEAKLSGRDNLPKGVAASLAKEVTYLGGKKVMRDASRIISDNGELSEYQVHNLLNDYLSDSNRDFRVIAAVGPQTTGKSTILSMLAGNQPLDLFRQYVFRPSSREAVEQSKHQSVKVSIYVSKARNIFIDCQPLSCASILDEQIQIVTSRERGQMRGGERLALQAQIENLQILAWTLQVSHTVLVCHDWFIDMDIVKQLRTAELLRGATDEIAAVTHLPKLSPTRRTNLLFVHTRARPNDFKPANRLERVEILKRLFGGAMRIRLSELPPTKANWDGEYALARPPMESIYFPLGEMKLREMSTPWQDERSGAHLKSNIGPPASRNPQQRAREKENESNRMNEFIADLSGAVPFDEGIVDLRRVVNLMPRESFTPPGAPTLTEQNWFRFACASWRDATFRSSVSLLESTIAARRKPYSKRESSGAGAATDRMKAMKI